MSALLDVLVVYIRFGLYDVSLINKSNGVSMKGAHKVFLTVLLVVSLFISINGHADWQYTSWGMTVDEVIDASGGVAMAVPEEEGIGKSMSSDIVKLTAPYSAGDFAFTAYFAFDVVDNTLIRVTLELHDKSKSHDLHGALRSRYGEPESKNQFYTSTFTLWYDDEGDQIDFQSIGDSVVDVNYKPRVSRRNSGL